MWEQIFTVISVLVGAGASFAATSFAERSRFERSMATRWDDRTLTVYVDYVSSIKALFRHGREALRLRDRGEDPTSSLAQLDLEEHRRSLHFETVLLLGSDDVRETAHRVNKEIWRLNELARSPQGREAQLDEKPLFALLTELGATSRDHLRVHSDRR